MQPLNHNWPNFVLEGDFDPDTVTLKLGIQPTWFAKAGVEDPFSKHTFKTNYWMLDCADEDAPCDVQDQVIYLLGQVRSCKAEFAELCRKHQGNLNLFACLDGNIDGFWLDAPVIRELAELNIDIDCKYIRSSQIDEKAAN